MSSEKIRAFVAVRLSELVERAIAEFQTELRGLGGDVSWARAENFHLTLKFLGAAVELEKVNLLREQLDRIAIATEPFQVDCQGAGAFPNLSRARVIWVAFKSEHLIKLAEQVENAASQLGFEAEERRYSPHLTIGRVRSPKTFASLRKAIEGAERVEFGESTIDRVEIYRSRLSPSGAKYEVLGSLVFGNQPAA